MPKQTKKEKNQLSMRRRWQAYNALKELAQKCGIMQHGRDGHGYDEMIGMLESGEFQLELVQQETK
jgi:hypothetical protein